LIRFFPFEILPITIRGKANGFMVDFFCQTCKKIDYFRLDLCFLSLIFLNFCILLFIFPLFRMRSLRNILAAGNHPGITGALPQENLLLDVNPADGDNLIEQIDFFSGKFHSSLFGND
jgi:hypothetical protein